jgi:hypothetical protein
VTADVGPVDVALSYAPSTLTAAWLGEFLPLLESWLHEYLGRPAVIVHRLAQRTLGSIAEIPRGRTVEIRGVALVLLSRASTQSAWVIAEIEDTLRRVGPERVIPMRLDRSVDAPEILRDRVMVDFSDFALVGEGFTKTERYVEFQARVRELARAIADAVDRADRADLR